MNRVFVRTHEFDKCWGKFGLTENDIIALEEHLCVNPQAGVVIPGTGGLRKLRWALPNQGKSGSIRVVYVDFLCYDKLYLISAYPKNEKENLTNEEKNEIKKLIKQLGEEVRKNSKKRKK